MSKEREPQETEQTNVMHRSSLESKFNPTTGKKRDNWGNLNNGYLIILGNY
jgi:hypothetical protein